MKENKKKLFFCIFLNPIWHNLHYQHKIWGLRARKKSKLASVGYRQKETISRNWLTLAKNEKVVLLSPKIDQTCFNEWRIC